MEKYLGKEMFYNLFFFCYINEWFYCNLLECVGGKKLEIQVSSIFQWFMQNVFKVQFLLD